MSLGTERAALERLFQVELDSSIRKEPQVVWVIIARLALLSVALLSVTATSFFLSREQAARAELLFLPLFGLFAFCGLSAIWLKFFRPSGWFTYTQLAADVFLITGIIYVTGGPGSPFLFLYLPLMMATVIFFSRRVALVSCGFSSIAYGALCFAMSKGFLPPIDGTLVVPVPTGGLFLQWLGLTSAAILVSVLTGFLTRKVTSHVELFERSQSHLRALLSRQQQLFDGLPEGVLFTNQEGEITYINEAAEMILERRARDVFEMRIDELSYDLGCSCDLRSKMSQESGSGELSFSLGSDDNAVRKVEYQHRMLRGTDGERIGTAFIFQDITHLRSIEEQLAVQERLARLLVEGEEERKSAPRKIRLDGFIGESPVMLKMFALIERVAPSDATVLISGESGTGKELVARAVHLGGNRSDSNFVPVNCGAIPDSLLESELFGHKKGSFTGAVSDHVGLFRQADGGTIFLDEIGELPLQMQAKLLRAIQEKQIRPVGSDVTYPIDVRIIAATNRNLKDEVEAGRFRDDLFYRLNVISMSLPPLRDRKEDIPLLVHSILERLSQGERPPIVPPQTMQFLMRYSYPGNVRELENILERAVVLSGEAILPEHLPESVLKEPAPRENRPGETLILETDIDFPVNLDDLLNTIEKHYLVSALSQSDGIKKKAAELLGMNFRSFRYRLQKFDL
ncbi:MAG: sigma 54-interacting transcriptional regulator [Bdellovibrionales bacterium]|nr:sigma 54-interacting transcriptional regulator [Bdellovibrionales bacterium]